MRLGRAECTCFCCEELIRRARRPPGARRAAAVGRIAVKRSTARRVTTSNKVGWLAGNCSARAGTTLMFVNVRARMTSRRKVAFLWLDSISVTAISGAQSFMGMPGKPAPDPRSATVIWSLVVRRWSLAESTSKSFNAENAEIAEEGRGNRCWAAKRLSPKWRVTISSSSWIAVRLMRAFQRWSISMYVDIWFSCAGERTAGSLRLRSGHASTRLAALGLRSE